MATRTHKVTPPAPPAPEASTEREVVPGTSGTSGARGTNPQRGLKVRIRTLTGELAYEGPYVMRGKAGDVIADIKVINQRLGRTLFFQVGDEYLTGN